MHKFISLIIHSFPIVYLKKKLRELDKNHICFISIIRLPFYFMMEIGAVLFIFCFLSACKSKTETEIKTIKIELNKIHVESINDIITHSDTIFLETTPASLIGSIAGISFIEDKIFILDSKYNKLLVFSDLGTFICNIGTKGHAGNEFIGINDFFCQNDTVFMYDFNGKKILKFDINGSYISNIPIEQSFSQIQKLPNNEGYVVLNTFSNLKDNPKFSWMSNDFKVKHSSREQRLNGTNYSNSFFQHDTFLVYWELFNDTIYSVTGEAVTPKYVIDFMSYAIPSSIEKDISKIEEYYKRYSSRIAGMINNVLETDDFFAFMFTHDMASHWALMDKKNDNLRIFRIVDINKSFGKLNYITTFHNGWFYGLYAPDELSIDDNYSLIRFKISNL